MRSLNRASFERALAHIVGHAAALRLPRGGDASVTERTLVARSTSLGDFTVFIPFLATIAQQEPDLRLLLVSRTGNVGATLLPRWRDRIMVIDPGSRASTISGVQAARAALRSRHVSRILYAPQNSDQPDGKLRRLGMLRAAAGFHVPVRGLAPMASLCSRAELEQRPGELALNQALAPFVACGIEPGATRAECNALFGFGEGERRDAAALARQLGADLTAPAVAMYVHAKDDRKRWPLERFIEIASGLTRRSGRQVWLIGGPEDIDASQHVAAALPRGCAVVLAGRADIRATLVLLGMCNLFVGNDGSATHFAALRGCPCVTVFCNWEVPGLWEPIAAPASRSIRPAWSSARQRGDFGIATIPTVAVREAIDHLASDPRGHYLRTISADGSAASDAVHLILPFGGPLRPDALTGAFATPPVAAE